VPPRVSILLPAWNAAATIGVALESIRRQTVSSWECVVVDDGSEDATPDLVARLAVTDPRVRLLRTAHHGLISALNTGLDDCAAPLIARMDADDVMHRRRLEYQTAALERDRSLSAVGCRVRIFPRRALSARMCEYEIWLNSLSSAGEVLRDAFIECPVAHPTLMMTRTMATLRYRDCGWPEDYDLVLRALVAGFRIGVVPKRLLAWRDHAHRASRSDPRYSLQQFTRCKAHHLARGYLASVATYVLWGYGDTGRELRAALAAHHKHPSHIVEVKRGRIGQRIHGAHVIAIPDLAALEGQRIVVSVARAGPRAEIRAALQSMRFVEGIDFVCAA
jgi:glycosyltransferase involved in cell wall biosynthesis